MKFSTSQEFQCQCRKSSNALLGIMFNKLPGKRGKASVSIFARIFNRGFSVNFQKAILRYNISNTSSKYCVKLTLSSTSWWNVCIPNVLCQQENDLTSRSQIDSTHYFCLNDSTIRHRISPPSRDVLIYKVLGAKLVSDPRSGYCHVRLPENTIFSSGFVSPFVLSNFLVLSCRMRFPSISQALVKVFLRT